MTSKRHLPRVKHLADRHAMQLFEVATAEVEAFGGRKTMVSDSMRPFRIALATDPTSKAMYSTAVIKWLLHGVMRFEDARIVRDTKAHTPTIEPAGRRSGGFFRSGPAEPGRRIDRPGQAP